MRIVFKSVLVIDVCCTSNILSPLENRKFLVNRMFLS